MPAHFQARSSLPVSAQQAFAWHCAPGAFERLLPPWEDVQVMGEPRALEAGQILTLRPRVGPLRLRWVAKIERLEPEANLFQDVQQSGPFAAWEHTHRMLPQDAPESAGDSCILEDSVVYKPPFGPLGRLGGFVVRSRLKDMFQWRHEVTLRDLARHQSTQSKPPMKILISGASGMVGSNLVPFLTTGGHQVLKLVRGTPKTADEIQWSVEGGVGNKSALEGLDAVVHLAGENIAAGRWSDAMKARITKSRIQGTRRIVEALAGLKNKPKVFVCASAIGYYGSRGDEVLDETSTRGEGFLSDVVFDWEAEAAKLAEAGVRTVMARLGVVLSPTGGALKKMLLPFKMGGGGTLGNGNQWMSWVALDDVVGAIHHAIVNDKLEGPVNVTAPGVVTNRTYTKTLGKVLGRPTIIPLPGFGLKLAFGEMGEELLLGSQRVSPKTLEASGFRFDYPDLEGALRHLLGKKPISAAEIAHSA